MSRLIRYDNPVSGTRDIDGDHIADGGKSTDAPRYDIGCNTPSAVVGWMRLTLSLAKHQPLWFFGGLLFIGYVIIPIAVSVPIALLTAKPVMLTEREAGGALNAHANNLTVGARTFLGSAFQGVQEAQIRQNTEKADTKPSENLVPRARVVFAEN